MKKSIYLIFALLTICGVISCSDDNIGSSIADTRSEIIQDSSFTMTGTTVLNSKIQARTSTQLVGTINSPGYGQLTSEVVTQLMPARLIDTAKVVKINSCRLTLTIAKNGFIGDSVAPMRMNVYKLKKQLPTKIYSDFDPSEYYSEDDLLGTVSYSPQSASKKDTVISGSSMSWYEVYVPLSTSFAQSMYELYKTKPEAFSDPEIFRQHYPGLYIKNVYGSGRVMNFYATEMTTFYGYRYQRKEGTDTIMEGRQSYVASTPEVITNNNIKLTPGENVKKMVANGDAVVMGPAGYEVNVKFPIQEIIDNYKKSTSDGLSLINSLELVIPVEEIKNDYNIAPPAYLLMVKQGKKKDFFEGDSLTNNKDSFYATYDATKKQYAFTGLREYVLNIIQNQNGIAGADDINLTVTPIDVTTYTTNSSYSSSQTTVVTKIAPSVAQPGLAKLCLDKAKIKIVYSKQSLY